MCRVFNLLGKVSASWIRFVSHSPRGGGRGGGGWFTHLLQPRASCSLFIYLFLRWHLFKGIIRPLFACVVNEAALPQPLAHSVCCKVFVVWFLACVQSDECCLICLEGNLWVSVTHADKATQDMTQGCVNNWSFYGLRKTRLCWVQGFFRYQSGNIKHVSVCVLFLTGENRILNAVNERQLCDL